MLAIADWKGKSSNFGPNAEMDPDYPHLRRDNVYDIRKGYELYRAGLIVRSQAI